MACVSLKKINLQIVLIFVKIFLLNFKKSNIEEELNYQPSKVINVQYCSLEDEQCLEFNHTTISQNLNENYTLKQQLKRLQSLKDSMFYQENFNDNQFYLKLINGSINILTRNAIQKGQLLFQLKDNQFLHQSSYGQNYFEQVDRIYLHLQAPRLEGLKNPKDYMALNILYHCFWVQDSIFEKYLMSIPRNIIDFPLLTFSNEEWDLLDINKTNLRKDILSIKKEINKGYFEAAGATQKQWMDIHERLFRDYFRRRDLAMSDFVWARWLILSHAIHDPLSEKAYLTPIFDLIKPQEILSPSQIVSKSLSYQQIVKFSSDLYQLKIYSDRDIPKDSVIDHSFPYQGKEISNLKFLALFGYVPKINHNIKKDQQFPQYWTILMMKNYQKYMSNINRIYLLKILVTH